MNEKSGIWQGQLFRGLLAVILGVYSAITQATPHTEIYYVEVTYDIPHHGGHGQTAYIFDKNFERLPDHPQKVGTSVLRLPDESALWYLGAKIDMVVKDAQNNIDVVSDDPRYYEMNHHFTMQYVSNTRPVYDPCGNVPIGSGSELTDIRLPSGYGYRMAGGFLTVGGWHWNNPYALAPGQKVYLRLTVLMDDASSGYRDTHVTSIGTNPCGETVAIPPGQFVTVGEAYVAPTDGRIVSTFPHVHDHVTSSELRRNGETVRRFVPDNALIGVAHDDVGEGETPLHFHPRHLPSEGITSWTPGINGPVFNAGDEFRAFARYLNPHERAIDNMNIFITFWEEFPDNGIH